MKILWVKAGGLVPPDTGGKIRSYHILKELAREHEVTFFTFYGAHENDVHPQLKDVFADVHAIPLQLPATRSAAELREYIPQLFTTEPYSITKYCRPEVAHEFRRVLDSRPFDVILCDFVFAAGVVPWTHPVPKVLFTHNVEAMIWKRHYEVASNPLWKLSTWREWKTMERAERQYLRAADHVLAVSDADRDFFRAHLPVEKISVVPTGVDVDFFQPSPVPVKPNSLVFTGSMDWMPNDDGIAYFAEEILPLIREEIPETTLCVVGRRPSKRMQSLAGEHRFELTGWVDDIRPHLAQGAVCIVPLRVGSGTRLKIFEAMAMGKAVVSTTIGAEGLPVQHGENLLLADTPADFAREALACLRDQSLRSRLESASRRLVEEKYSWTAVAREFSNILTRVAQRSDQVVSR